MHASGDGRSFGRDGGGHRRFGGDGDSWRGEHRFGGEGGGWHEGQGFGNEGHRFGHDRGRIHELMGNENGDEQESQL